jgi:peptide deformylase
MGILEIRKFNDPVLRRRSKKVWRINEDIHRLVLDMAQTMKEREGVGLAASQVGELKRIIVVETDYRTRKALALINPKIVKKSREKIVFTEGCLSFPNIFIDVKRSKQVTVKAKDVSGEKIELKAEGLLARVLQHEIDHLNGKLFFDRLNIFKRIKFKLKNPSLKV